MDRINQQNHLVNEKKEGQNESEEGSDWSFFALSLVAVSSMQMLQTRIVRVPSIGLEVKSAVTQW